MKILPKFSRFCVSVIIGILSTFLLTAAEPNVTVTGIVELGDPPRMRRQARNYSASQQQAGEMPRPLPVVYLENGQTAGSTPPEGASASMKQENLQFHPAILAIQRGTTVSFPNLDSTFHNVFSYSPTKPFDLGRYRSDEAAPEITFEEPGVIQLFCEVHEHMRATILVLDTPFFTLASPDGSFEIGGVPPGTYSLVVWHSPRRQIMREVVIPPNQSTFHLDLTELGK